MEKFWDSLEKLLYTHPVIYYVYIHIDVCVEERITTLTIKNTVSC